MKSILNRGMDAIQRVYQFRPLALYDASKEHDASVRLLLGSDDSASQEELADTVAQSFNRRDTNPGHEVCRLAAAIKCDRPAAAEALVGCVQQHGGRAFPQVLRDAGLPFERKSWTQAVLTVVVMAQLGAVGNVLLLQIVQVDNLAWLGVGPVLGMVAGISLVAARMRREALSRSAQAKGLAGEIV